MKKNTLYTVNPWNKGIFKEKNLYAFGDFLKKDNPNYIGGWMGADKISDSVGSMIGGLGTVAGGIANKVISGDYSSGVGNAIGTVGSTVGSALSKVNPVLGSVVSVGSGIVGGGVNKLFGKSVDEAALGRVNNDTAMMNNYTSNASNFDEITGIQGVQNVGKIIKGGIFNKGVEKENARLRQELADAVNHAYLAQNNNIDNLKSNQFNGLLANVSALGGPLQPFTQQTGALGIMQQDKYINAINNRTNAIAKNAQAPYSFSATGNRFDAGGDIDAAFFDAFTSGNDPLGAVAAYNQARENLANQEAARRDAEAQQAALQDTMGRLQASEIQNQGLLSLLNAQGQSIDVLRDQLAGLQEAGNAAADTQATAPQTEAQGAPGGSLREFIKSHEGWLGNAYWLDGETAPTIGYGFHMVYPGTNKKVKMGDRITREEGDRYLDVAINNLSNILSKKVPNWGNLSSNQKDALIDLAYATGPYGKHFQKNSKLFQALAAGDMETAAKHLYASSASKKEYNKYLKKVGEARRDMFTNGNYKMKAFGGELGTNGTDFTSGLLEVNTGDSHEENPYGGIQLGVDQEGVPNLVEEGETVFNDYVFSNRLKVPSFMRKQLGLGGSLKKDITFADASKKIVKDSKERPNNPMDQEYMEGALGKLAMVQETERSKMKAEQENQMLEAAMFGFGGKKGNKFADGSKVDRSNIKPYAYSKDWTGFKYFDPSKGEYNKGYLDFAKNINQNWVDRILAGKYGDMQRYFAKNQGEAPTPAQVAALATDKKYSDMHKAVATAYEDYLNGMDPVTGKISLSSNLYDSNGNFRGVAPDNRDLTSIVREIAPAKTTVDADDMKALSDNVTKGTQAAAAKANQPKPYPTWMRYAPVFGAGIMTLTDALGLTNKPDYTFADKIEAAANRIGYAPDIQPSYIGDYMRYQPLDRLFYANQLQANARATDRNLMNTSGGNSGTARAAMIANGYNSNNVIGNMLRQEAESNRAQYERTKEFNRKTNMVNAEMDMRAREANARYRHMANSAWLQGLGQAAALRDSIDQRVGAARSLNIKNLLDSLGNIGRENFALNQIRSDRAYNYAPTSIWWRSRKIS